MKVLSGLIFLAGALAAAALTALLAFYSPQPGNLSSAHAAALGAPTLETCERCHASGKLAENCLECHVEIAAQLDETRGYHSYLLQEQRRCTPCHREHHGPDFPLTSELSWRAQVSRAFTHPHTEYALDGRHDDLSCEECHVKELLRRHGARLAPTTTGLARQGPTFLGLTQDCAGCHEDPHAGGHSWACDSCHGQDAFSPTPHFDHGVHFPFDGGHRGLECLGCHVFPPAQAPQEPRPFPFDHVRGTTCKACHATPHRASFAGDCETCHPRPEPQWQAAASLMTAEDHAVTGFPLASPHERVACKGCHTEGFPYAGRHPDPALPGYGRQAGACEGCHEDVHLGQFQGKHPRCLDCHEAHGFLPPRFGRAEHAEIYLLTGAHDAVPCTSCHLIDPGTHARRFAGTRRQCRDCHESPHGDQFLEAITSGDCHACHREATDTFRIRPFDHLERAGWGLEGAHAQADCTDCHVEVLASTTAGPLRVRRYRGTPESCSGCHTDVHRGQFDGAGKADCATCHRSQDAWHEVTFDHDRQSRFPLEGVHARAACSRCHPEQALEDGSRVVHYRPLGRECKDCHEVPTDPSR
jgi:hypothetical protein